MSPADVTGLLRDMRHQAGLTQRELGKRLGWATQRNVYGTAEICPNVSKYETGRTPATPELISRWAAACGFHAELTGSGRWVIEVNDKATP